jgi:TAP-like protein
LNASLLTHTSPHQRTYNHEAARAAAADRGTALGDYPVAQLAAACRERVKGDAPPDYARPARSDAQALLVTGTLDPNTNERWGDEAARYLPRAMRVVIPNLSHGFSRITDCGANFIATFIATSSMQGVDISCKDRIQLPPFVLGIQ